MKITISLILLCIAGFIFTLFGVTDINAFFATFGFSGINLIERPYTLITSIFLHGGIDHLISNIFVLFFFGMAIEKELGKVKMLAIFLLGAFAGDLLSLLVYSPETIAIGASAGIFALIGIGMIMKPVDLSFYPMIIPIPLALLGIAYVIFNVYEFVAMPYSNISYIAHFGGLAVGLLFGFRQEGWRKGLKILLIALAIMIIIPLLWILLF